MKYDYVTYSKNGSKYGFVDKDNYIIVYVNDKEWGVPQGNRFLRALLKDIEILNNK